jgi:hypothetical protein
VVEIRLIEKQIASLEKSLPTDYREMVISMKSQSYTLLVKAAPPPRKALQPDHQDDQKEGIEQSKQVF